MKRSEHLAGFSLALVLVILGGRALAYAATPTPLAAQLGGPRLPVITFVALAARRRDLTRRALARGPRRTRAARARSRPRAPTAPRAGAVRPGCRTARGRLAARLRRARDLGALARGHAHALVDVPRRAGAPQRDSDPDRAVAGGCGAARRRCATRSPGLAASSPCCGDSCSRAPPGGRSRSCSGASRLPPGCSRALCAPAGRPRSPSRSQRHERENVMNRISMRRAAAYAAVLVATLALAPSAFAHAELFPNQIPSGDGVLLNLAVPNEKEDASTTQIQITMPADFDLEHVAQAPGWTATVTGHEDGRR